MLPLELHSNDQPVGRITSTAFLLNAGLAEVLGLGFVRLEALERNQEITYHGGVVTALSAPPVTARPPA
jgi:hypothetical protein